MSDMSQENYDSSSGRLGLSTYRSFYLKREELRVALEVSIQCGQVSVDLLRARSAIGIVHCEAAIRFARACGLISSNRRLNELGTYVYEHDPYLEDVRTLWILHYNMVRPHTFGPLFWPDLHRCILNHPYELIQTVSERLSELAEKESASSSRTVKYALTAFLGTYTEFDGLGPIGIMNTDRVDYSLGTPDVPPLGVISYVVADYWNAHWPDSKSIALGHLSEHEEGPASLLMMSSGAFEMYLSEMADKGWLEIHRKAPPYTVYRLWEHPSEMMRRLYND